MNSVLNKLSWVLLPKHAIQNVKASMLGVQRIVRLLRGQQSYHPAKDTLTLEQLDQLNQGKTYFKSLKAQERFAQQLSYLNLDPQELAQRYTVRVRAYRVRCFMFWLAVLFLPNSLVNYGVLVSLFNVLCLVLFALTTLREYVYVHQLKTQALWSWDEMVTQKNGQWRLVSQALLPFMSDVASDVASDGASDVTSDAVPK